jgi:hypothetical protein
MLFLLIGEQIIANCSKDVCAARRGASAAQTRRVKLCMPKLRDLLRNRGQNKRRSYNLSGVSE